MRLADAAVSVHACLVDAQTALFKLRQQDRDLLPSVLQPGFGSFDLRSRLIDSRIDLIVINYGDNLSALDVVAFADGDLADAARSFGRDDRVIAFDSPAHFDNFFRF